jgi:endonuclease/exonuclease/phosphatase family metal-dependent hydrolase
MAGSTTLRVLSFNIRYNNPKDGPNAWPQRKEMVASMLRFHNLDLIGLQEARKEQVDDLAQRLPQFAYLGVGRDDGHEAGEYVLILYRPDRFELLDQATFWLSEMPDQPGKGWDAHNPRIATWAKFRDKQTGQSFFHFNTHFDNWGEHARAESAHLLLSRIEAIAGPTPVVVTGDFNCTEDSYPYRLLIGAGSSERENTPPPLQDARYQSHYPHHGPTQTTNDDFAGTLRDKIDYIFIKNQVQVHQHGILPDHWDGRYPSDHLPVLAELELEV